VSVCFDPFPFPICTDLAKARLKELGQRLDSHRRRQQAQHPKLTVTGTYNVLAKLRAGTPLDDKDKVIHEQGLVSVLREVHDELDAAVFDAYGWPDDLTDEQVLERLVALNAERAAEERNGLVRWLRPEFQNPTGVAAAQIEIAGTDSAATTTAPAAKASRNWPKDVPAQLAAVKALFDGGSINLSIEDVCAEFKGARKDKVLQHLASLEGLGLLDRFESSGVARWHA